MSHAVYQTFIFTLIDPLLGIRDENQMFASGVDIQRKFWRSHLSWKCYYFAQIKWNWRYLHCISQQINY